MEKRSITTSIALTPELLAAIKRKPITLTAQAIQDIEGWTLEKSTMAIDCSEKLGWVVCGPSDIDIKWTGEISPESLHIETDDKQFDIQRLENGVIAFKLPWLFKTDCPNTGLSVRSIPGKFNPNIYILDSVIEPKPEPYEVMIYWKIINPNVDIRVSCNDGLGFIQLYNIEIAKEANLVMEEYNASILT